jgi:hypothetical protein
VGLYQISKNNNLFGNYIFKMLRFKNADTCVFKLPTMRFFFKN